MSLPSCGKVLNTLFLALNMFRATLSEKPDLIHLFKPKGYGGLAAMLHLWLQRVGIRMAPLFLDTDDWEGAGGMNDLLRYSSLDKRVFAFQESWLLKRAVGVTCASRTLKNLAEKMGVPPERICYLPNCAKEIPSGNSKLAKKKMDLPLETLIVLLYTRFFEFSQERLYRIIQGVQQLVPTVRFLVIGKGRNHEEDLLLAASRKMGLYDAIIITGWVKPFDIPDYLAIADVAIYPLDDTLINRAKCPAKLTELLVAGVPVVADKVGQANEYILDGVSGILSDPVYPEQMINGVVQLLRDSDARKKMASEGRRYLLEHFNWRDSAVKLDQFYRRITFHD